MNPATIGYMDIMEIERLTRLGDMSKDACSIRLLAARLTTGLSQLEASEFAGIANNALNNMEKGRQFPNREIMRYYHRAHRIDFNFILHGDFAQLPQDTQAALVEKLAAFDRFLREREQERQRLEWENTAQEANLREPYLED